MLAAMRRREKRRKPKIVTDIGYSMLCEQAAQTEKCNTKADHDSEQMFPLLLYPAGSRRSSKRCVLRRYPTVNGCSLRSYTDGYGNDDLGNAGLGVTSARNAHPAHFLATRQPPRN